MKKVILVLMFVLLIGGVMAHGEETFEEAEEIIIQKISCDELTENQLEVLGDYYMEQMHPGELHEIMDEKMGGEGSESLRQAHINMALAFYCGEHDEFSGSMMDVMMGRTEDNSYGMMGSYGMYGFNWFRIIIQLAVTTLLVLLIIWFIRKLNEKPKKRKRK